VSPGFTIEELRARHAELTAEREKQQQAAHERDIGFAYVLGELETMIALIEQRDPKEEEESA
jgi:hypothetical protein